MNSEETDDPHFVFVPPILALFKRSYSPKLTFITGCGQSTIRYKHLSGGVDGTDISLM
jgi:hypothetical protein